MHQGAPGEARHWSLPGGIVEDGELVTEALVREVREETGVEISDVGRVVYIVQSTACDLRSSGAARGGRRATT